MSDCGERPVPLFVADADSSIQMDVSAILKDGSIEVSADALLTELEGYRGRLVTIGGGVLRAVKPVIEFADGIGRLDPNDRQVVIADQLAQLTGKEYAILELLAQTPDELVGREEIVTKIWNKPPTDYKGHSSAITTMTRLRKNLDKHHAGLGHKASGVIRTDHHGDIARYALLSHWPYHDLSTENR